MVGEDKIQNENIKRVLEKYKVKSIEKIEKEEKDGVIKYRIKAIVRDTYLEKDDEFYYYFITDGNFIIYSFTLDEEISEAFIDHSLYYEMLKKLGWENKIKEIEKMFYEEVKKLFAKMKKNEEKIKELLKDPNNKVFEYHVYTDGFKLLIEASACKKDSGRLIIFSWDDPKEAEEFIDNLPNEYVDWKLGKLDHASILLAKWLFQHDKHLEVESFGNTICIPCHLFCPEGGCADGVHCDGSCGVDKNNIKIVRVKDFKIALRDALMYD